MAESLQDAKDAAKRKRMEQAYEDAPYHSMGTKPPVRNAPVPKTKRAQEPVAPEPMPSAMRDLEDEKMRRRMEEAYDQAAPRSMKRGFAKGGSVSSASRRADGIAQRGKTKGKVI
jgi:hypothetical protein